jgi:gliding motility-associated-like protein
MSWGENLLRYVLTFCLMTFAVKGQSQTTADCANLLVVCGVTSLSLNSNGIGVDDFSIGNNSVPQCFQAIGTQTAENQSLWLKVPINRDGPLSFTIIPNNPADDFDFAVFGPNVSCDNLGQSVRCSTTAPGGPLGINSTTGLRLGESTNNEGPGFNGDGFVRHLDVKAGEEYIIFIDNFSTSNAGFKLDWTNSIVVSSPPLARQLENLLECDPDGDGFTFFDLTVVETDLLDGLPGTSVSYHLTEEDALLGNNPIGNKRNYRNTMDGEEIFARLTVNGSECSNYTSFLLEVNPDPVVDSIDGASSVCPSVVDVPYTVNGSFITTYDWIVEGGVISHGQNTDSITVDWRLANDAAIIKLLVSNGTGCEIDTVFYDVKINKRLEPELPQGDAIICFADKGDVVYEVPFVPGSEYEWSATNGTIIGGNNQSQITVNWDDNTSIGEVYFREFNPSIADCEGYSDTLKVEILDEIIIGNVITQPLCFGENNGRIQLTVSGGRGDKEVTWNNGDTGELLENVISGIYEYTVTDEMGCVVSAEIELLQPELLVVTNFNPINALCFTSSDGTGEATVAGGTGVYAYQWTGPNFSQQTSVNTVVNLSRGDYNVQVSDENGCIANLPFTIGSPELLLPDLNALINLPICPGTNDGEISIDALGGVPDYQFFWELNTNQAGNVASGLSVGDYSVRIVDANGCEATLDLEVTEFIPRVSFPTAFTPNGDGENDEFGAVVGCTLPEYNFKMFNKWGEMIFYTEDQNVMWDGKYKGENVPSGGYSYIVFYRVLANDIVIDESINGSIRLFR